MVKVIHLHRSI